MNRTRTGMYAGQPKGKVTEARLPPVCMPRAMRDAFDAEAERLCIPVAVIVRGLLCAWLKCDGATAANMRELMWALRDRIDGIEPPQFVVVPPEAPPVVDPRQLTFGA